MSTLKTLYLTIILGTLIYFMIYGVLMRKLLVVQISIREVTGASEVLEPDSNGGDTIDEHFPRETNELESYEYGADAAELEAVQATLDSIKKLIDQQSQKTQFWDQLEENPITLPEESERADASNVMVSFLQKFGSDTRKSTAAAAGGEFAPTGVSDRSSMHAFLEKLDNSLEEQGLSADEPCPKFPTEGEVAPRKDGVTLEEVRSQLRFVAGGGRWKPTKCKARQNVAIMIPFRNRQEHLNVFLRHIHEFLKLQLLDYRLFVVEQVGEEKFNRGALMNIGFTEALKVRNFTCVIFHDVDLLPLDTRNDYGCPSSPRHMSPAVDTKQFTLQYESTFNGVQGFWKEHFLAVNGFPNRYWGWGGEDDDLYQRILERNLHLTRPAQMIGKYTMLTHGLENSDINQERFDELRSAAQDIDNDGLNSLRYELLSSEELPLYTLMKVQPLKA